MNESRIKILKEENIDKALFKLGIPMVISLLVAALYNVVDTYCIVLLLRGRFEIYGSYSIYYGNF